MTKIFFKNSQAQTLRGKADRVLFQIIALAALFLSGLAVLALKFFQDIYAAGRFIFGKIEAACACAGQVSFFTHPWLFSALFLGGLMLLLALILAVYTILRLCLKTRKFVRVNVRRQKDQPSDKLAKISRELGIADRVAENESKEPIVFCYGYRRPKICISSTLISRLSESELTAVLAHEKFHMQAREPVKLLIVRIISLLFFFAPGVKLLAGKYVTFSELAADEAATAGFTNKIPLAQALHKIIGWEQKRALGRMFALSFFSSVTEERVRKLTDESYVPSAAWLNKKILVSAFCALFLFVGANNFLSSRIIQNSLVSHTHSNTCQRPTTKAQTLASAMVCAPQSDSESCTMGYANLPPSRC
ncbi:MAG: M56 family metallopeptidase [Patescibacteria group bacterium]